MLNIENIMYKNGKIKCPNCVNGKIELLTSSSLCRECAGDGWINDPTKIENVENVEGDKDDKSCKSDKSYKYYNYLGNQGD